MGKVLVPGSQEWNDYCNSLSSNNTMKAIHHDPQAIKAGKQAYKAAYKASMRQLRKEKEAADAAFCASLYAGNVVDNTIVFNRRNVLENILIDVLEEFFSDKNKGEGGERKTVKFNQSGFSGYIGVNKKGEYVIAVNNKKFIFLDKDIDALSLVNAILPARR